jgi:hypothetical protein
MKGVMMSLAAHARPITSAERGWLRSRNWDLTFITLSVILVAAPYLAYLGLLRLDVLLGPLANQMGASVDSLSRNLVNAFVALAVGGPHMYATFSRTALDHEFVRRHPVFLWSSVAIPVVVVVLALLNLTLLLTVFFFWASIHVLHQIVYVTELYNHKRRSSLRLPSRAAEYAVILTALYPLAAWKIASGKFLIGSNDISAVVGRIVPLGSWMV